MAIIGQLTLDQIGIFEVDSDPSASGAIAAIGSMALLYDGTNSKMWTKVGAGDSAWVIVPRSNSATAYAIGSIPFADASGFLIASTKIVWDNTNNRLALGANAPATPQSTIHLDKGTGIGTHIRMTAGSTTGQAAGDGTEWGIDDAGNAEIRQYENNAINFLTNNLVRGTFTNDGKFILGNDTAIDVTGAGALPQFQIIGTASVQMAGIQYSADTIAPVFNLIKSRNPVIGLHTILNAADELGRIQFRGSDGTNFQAGASIRALVDAAPGSGSMPGRLILMTTPAAAVTPVERLRIDSVGQAIFSQNIRLGAQVDTTNGGMQFDGAELLGRQAGVWRNLVMVPVVTTSVTPATTTSGTYQILTETSLTPAAGTYLVLYSGAHSITVDGTTDVALHIAAAEIADTRRNLGAVASTGTADATGALSFNTLITVNGSQVVDVRYRRNLAGTAGVNGRIFILIPVAR